MINATRYAIFALMFNIIVLVPVVLVLMMGLPPADYSFGPVTEARLILT